MSERKKMNLKVAEAIWKEFGAHIATSLESLVFGLNIPEGLLPYPKEKIREALNIGKEYSKTIDDQEAIKTMNNGLEMLEWYVDDYEGVKKASKIWESKVFREYVKTELYDFQKRNFKSLIEHVEKLDKDK